MNHYRKTKKLHTKRGGRSGCPFCREDTLQSAVYEDKYIYVAPNLTEYDLWELHDVEEHLLVMPKRHVENLNELTKHEKMALIDVLAEYESKGYSAYARGVGFVKRSVKHQHTHLIKVSNKEPKFALFFSRPYFLCKK
jgi:diadenosine tetraphosphate (Ap4A) HIT family hydrolase